MGLVCDCTLCNRLPALPDWLSGNCDAVVHDLELQTDEGDRDKVNWGRWGFVWLDFADEVIVGTRGVGASGKASKPSRTPAWESGDGRVFSASKPNCHFLSEFCAGSVAQRLAAHATGLQALECTKQAPAPCRTRAKAPRPGHDGKHCCAARTPSDGCGAGASILKNEILGIRILTDGDYEHGKKTSR